MSAGPVEIVGRRHDHDRHAAAEPFERNGELALAERARADAANVGETEHVAQQLLDETDRGAVRRGLARRQFGEERLADAEVARDLVAQREALGDAVVRLGLSGAPRAGDARQHRRRDQRAFDRDGIEGERGRAAVRARAMAQCPAGTRT